MKAKITRASVDALRKGKFISDTEIIGFIARKLPSGVVSFGYQYTGPDGKRRWLGLGLLGNITADEARTAAKKKAGLVADNRDPAKEAKVEAARAENTVQHICEEWLKRYARGEKPLRSADKVEGVLKRHVYAEIGDKVLYDLTRAEVTAMLDKVEDNSGAPMADLVLAYLRGVFNWWRLRDDNFITTPIVRGMARSNPNERRGKRKFDIEEIRDIWRALDEIEPGQAPSFYPAYIRTLFLTACRRNEVSHMHVNEFGEGNKIGDWTIPAWRYKTKIDFLLPLPEMIRGLLPEHRRGYVFSSDGGVKPFSGVSKPKAALDRAIAALRKREGRKPMPKWRLHDLRRTARSMMSQAKLGISRDHAECVLGHVIKGVEGAYDVHDYYDEKFAALTKFASYVLDAVNAPPSAPNVVKLKGRKKPAGNSNPAGLGKSKSAAPKPELVFEKSLRAG